MKLLNLEELQDVHRAIHPQLIKLYRHEMEKRDCNVFQIHFPLGLCYLQHTYNGDIYVLRNSKFCNIIDDYNKKFLLRKIDKSSPQSIISSLYPYCEEWYKSVHCTDDYSYFTDEACAYIIPVQSIRNNVTPPKMLRIDLFRLISKDGKGFIGGLFHVLQHFSIANENLSYKNDRFEVFDIQHIVYLIATTFAGSLEKDPDAHDTYIGHLDYKNKHLIAVFYHEVDSSVFFVDSLHIKR